MIKYFTVEKSLVASKRYTIKIDSSAFPFPTGFEGNEDILPARLLHLTYGQYLRYARDRLGAKIMSENGVYPIPHFKRSRELDELLILLNRRINFVIDTYEKGYIIEEKDGELIKVPFRLEE